jgi:hypothetical protein
MREEGNMNSYDLPNSSWRIDVDNLTGTNLRE